MTPLGLASNEAVDTEDRGCCRADLCCVDVVVVSAGEAAVVVSTGTPTSMNDSTVVTDRPSDVHRLLVAASGGLQPRLLAGSDLRLGVQPATKKVRSIYMNQLLLICSPDLPRRISGIFP